MKKDKIVLHVTQTSLAGAPIRIVNALNKYTNFSARLVNFYPFETASGYMFPEDLIWRIEQDKITAKELIQKADIIHFHNFMDLRFNNPFLINFLSMPKKECKLLHHFHSSKEYLQKSTVRFDEYYSVDKVPKIVIPHYPERTFPEFPILPNIIPINEKYCMPTKTNNKKLKVVFSASNKNSMYEQRWATKGYPEVSVILKQLSEKLDFDYIELHGQNFYEAMKIKQQSDIIIGDVVTGSYHLTELEGLSMGKPTLTYLDGRSVMTFINTFGSSDIPFVNVSIDELDSALEILIKNQSLRKRIGKFSRKWMETYYNEQKLIQNFVNIYKKLLNSETLQRKDCNEFSDVKEFLYNKVYDLKWEKVHNLKLKSEKT